MGVGTWQRLMSAFGPPGSPCGLSPSPRQPPHTASGDAGPGAAWDTGVRQGISRYQNITSRRPEVDLGGDSLLDIVQDRQLLIDDAALIAISV